MQGRGAAPDQPPGEGSPVGPVTAVVPLKGLARAKGRLSPALTADERRALTLDMFAHVMDVCAAVPALTRILVVAGDEDAAAAARDLGAEVIGDPGVGLNAAVTAADHRITGAQSLVLAADLPHATVDEVTHLLALAAALPEAASRPIGAGPVGAGPVGAGAVLVAPTSDGGTAALLRRPPRIIAPAYGPGSCARHVRAGAARGAVTGVVSLPGLAHDVDRPDDLPAGRFAS